MLFNIEADTGAEIVGYLVPDGYRETPRICVIGRGRVVWSGLANELREALVSSGRHATGQCGFRIGPSEVSELATLDDAELRDLETGLILYRRPGRRDVVPRRIFRIETRLAALHGLDVAMERFFQGWFPSVERFGRETVDQVFHLTGTDSVYASGRIWPASHPALASGAFLVVAALRDPYVELADRLCVLSGSRGPVEAVLPTRDLIALRPALDALEGTDLRGERALRRLFRRLSPEAALVLANPLARQLSCAGPGATAGAGAVATALRTLAGLDLVAVEEARGYFEASLTEMLGGWRGLPTLPPPESALADFADRLSAIRTAETLLETDLDIYANVASVFDSLAHAGTNGQAASGAAETNMRW